MMSILKYLDCKDPELRDDWEWHVFDNVFNLCITALPKEPVDPVTKIKHMIWTDGVEILCKTSELAETVANVLDEIVGDIVAHTGYYNPEEDALEPNGPFPTTGWYYVDFD